MATPRRLSNGRAGVHLVIGQRRRRAPRRRPRRQGRTLPARVEYLEVFTRALENRDPFDYHGEFYRLEDAGSGFLPIQRPRPPLSVGGSPLGAGTTPGGALR
ncbi:LLM class flavin-dependent oxidoreductase [Pseudomonas aeruginosa]|nr:LLM class flavin-dependent oxidoreductase [Pseudomonas aeruginosa]